MYIPSAFSCTAMEFRDEIVVGQIYCAIQSMPLSCHVEPFPLSSSWYSFVFHECFCAPSTTDIHARGSGFITCSNGFNLSLLTPAENRQIPSQMRSQPSLVTSELTHASSAMVAKTPRSTFSPLPQGTFCRLQQASGWAHDSTTTNLFILDRS